MQRGLAGAEARAELPPLLTTACPRGSTARRAAWRGSTGTAKAWEPTRDGLAGHGPSGPQPARPAGTGLPAVGADGLRTASGRAPGAAGDGQRKWQTVYGDLPTSRPSMSSANLPANTSTCRQRSALSAANAQDVAGINLPVDSQTLYTGQACKTIVYSGPDMRDVR